MTHLGDLTILNQQALDNAAESRESLVRSIDLDKLGSYVLSRKREFPYRGFVEVQPDPLCPSFLMFANNDDLVALHFLWAGNVGWEMTALKIWIYLCSLDTCDTVLDIGAFSGIYALIANNIGVKNIVAFEPGRMPSIRLVDNINANGASNIRVVTNAVSNYNGTAQFELVRDLRTLSSAGHISGEPAFGADIDLATVITIDRYLDRNPMGNVSAIKIDVEGEEYKLLNGMLNTLEQYKPDLIVEIKPKLVPDIVEYLKQFGYSGYLISELDGQIMNLITVPDSVYNYFFSTNADRLDMIRQSLLR